MLKIVGATTASAAELCKDFYSSTSPNSISLVKKEVVKAVHKEPRTGASLLRLHFHDYFVNVVMQGQVDLDNDEYVAEILQNLRTYHCEYVPGYGKIRLPILFSKDFFNEIANVVTLYDPIGNEFKVGVMKEGNEVFLIEQTELIGDFYNLDFGAWISFVYTRNDALFMRVKNRAGDEINYPIGPKRCGANFVCGSGERFFHSLLKRLGGNDISSSILELPLGFCELAFSKNCNHVQLVDERGMNWPCHLIWETGKHFHCNLVGGWQQLCTAKRLTEGTVIKLGASNDMDGNIYFKFA